MIGGTMNKQVVFKIIALVVMLSLVGFLALALYSNSVKADLPGNWTLKELNLTLPKNVTDLLKVNATDLLNLQQRPEPYYVWRERGILPRPLMELVIDTMVCGWVAFTVAWSALCLLNRRFVWGRKRTASIALSTVVGGVFLTFASWFYRFIPYVLDAEFVFFGYPFVWLSSGRSVFWGSLLGRSTEWTYSIQWYGLIGNIAFYMWIIFAATVSLMFLPRVFSKVVHQRARWESEFDASAT